MCDQQKIAQRFEDCRASCAAGSIFGLLATGLLATKAATLGCKPSRLVTHTAHLCLGAARQDLQADMLWKCS